MKTIPAPENDFQALNLRIDELERVISKLRASAVTAEGTTIEDKEEGWEATYGNIPTEPPEFPQPHDDDEPPEQPDDDEPPVDDKPPDDKTPDNLPKIIEFTIEPDRAEPIREGSKYCKPTKVNIYWEVESANLPMTLERFSPMDKLLYKYKLNSLVGTKVLTLQQEREFKLIAKNSYGEVTKSVTFLVTSEKFNPYIPGIPANVTFKLEDSLDGKSYNGVLTWDIPSDPDDYLAGFEWEIKCTNSLGQVIIKGSGDGKYYKCKRAHQSAPNNRPPTGFYWQTYWEETTTVTTIDWVNGVWYGGDTVPKSGTTAADEPIVRASLAVKDQNGTTLIYTGRVRSFDSYAQYSTWSSEVTGTSTKSIPPPPPVTGGISLSVASNIISARLLTTLPANYKQTNWYFSDAPNIDTTDPTVAKRVGIGGFISYPALSSWQGRTVYVKAIVFDSSDQQSSASEGNIYVPPYTYTPITTTPTTPPPGVIIPKIATFPEMIGPTESHYDWTTDAANVPGYSWTDLGQQASQAKILCIRTIFQYYYDHLKKTGCHLFAGTNAGGKILRSLDRGATWTDLGQLGSETDIYSIDYAGQREKYSGDYRIVIAGTGPNGKIYRTINADGYPPTWTDIGTLGASTKVYAVRYGRNGIFLAGTDTGRIFKSLDYGKTWIDKGQLGSETAVNAIEYLESGIFLAGTTPGGKIYRSADDGDTWSNIGQLGSETNVYCLKKIGTSELYKVYAGAGNKVFTSTDKGLTFGAGTTLTGETKVLSIEYVCDGTVVAGTNPLGKIFRQTDFGSWTDLGQQASQTDIYALTWIGDGICVAGTGVGGKILRSLSFFLKTSITDRYEGNASIMANIPSGAAYLNKWIKTIDLAYLDNLPLKMAKDSTYLYVAKKPQNWFTPEIILDRINLSDITDRKTKIIGQVNPMVIGMVRSGTKLYILSARTTQDIGYTIEPITQKAMLTEIDLADFIGYRTIIIDYEIYAHAIIPIADSLAVGGEYLFCALPSKTVAGEYRIYQIDKTTLEVITYLTITESPASAWGTWNEGIPVEADATNVYVGGNYSGGCNYRKITISTMTVAATKNIVGGYVKSMALDATFLYASESGYRRLQIADFTTTSTKAGGISHGISLEVDSSYLYCGDGSDTLERLLLSDFNTLSTKTGLGAHDHMDASDATYIWVGCYNGSSIFVLRRLTKADFTTMASQTYGFRNLTDLTHLKLWFKGGRDGQFYQLGMGETAVTEQTYSFSLNRSGMWESVTWDISGIANASKNAIRFFGVKITNTDKENYLLIDPGFAFTNIDPVYVDEKANLEWVILGRYYATGNDADKSGSPKRGMVYYASDTLKTYACFVDNSWTEILTGGGSVSLLERTLAYKIALLDKLESNVDANWTVTLVGTGSGTFGYDDVGIVGIYLDTSANTNDSARIFRAKPPILFYPGIVFKGTTYAQVIMQARVRLLQTTSCEVSFGLYSNSNPGIEPSSDCAHFFYDASGGANWQCRSYNAAEEQTNSGIAGNTTAVNLKIVWTSSSVKFYIDDVLKATHSTQVPAGTALIPVIKILTETTAAKIMTAAHAYIGHEI